MQRRRTIGASDNMALLGGAKAKNNDRIKKLRELLKDPTDLVVRTVKDRDAKPPRYFAEVWVDGENLNEAMRQAFP